MAGEKRVHTAVIGGFNLRLEIMGGRSSFAVLAKVFKVFGAELGQFIMTNADRLHEVKAEVMAMLGVEQEGTDEETIAKYKMSFIAHALPHVADGALLDKLDENEFRELGDLLFRQRLWINEIPVENPEIVDTMVASPITYGHIVLWAMAANLDPTGVGANMLAGSASTEPTRQRGSVTATAN